MARIEFSSAWRTLRAKQGWRFVVAGAWNSFVGWVVFSLFWLMLHDRIGLWAIAILSHLTATTQAFHVQRRFVFAHANVPLFTQYLRFQCAYGIQLLIGLWVISAFTAQGLHPLLTQPLAMLLLAVCGFFMSKTFVFAETQSQWRVLSHRVWHGMCAHRLAWAAFLVGMALFEKTWGTRFYSSTEHVGHDFALAGIGLLEGSNWIGSNGLVAGLFNPPWFTPAWCAGGALYADPQAAFYSPLQFFALWVDPFTASHLNTLLFAAVAFWGSYALVRQLLDWPAAAAALFATLGMANSFAPLRAAVGEVGYQPFYLWTLVVLALCWPVRAGKLHALAGPSFCTALCFTAWLQFGFGGMMVPAFLAAFLFCLALALLRKASVAWMVARSTAGAILAIVLNGSKLYESISLMRNFPRDFYGMPGFSVFGDALLSIMLALVQPSEWTAFFAMRRLAHVQFTVLPHEWALEFGWGAFLTALLLGLMWLWSRRKTGFNTSHGNVTPGDSMVIFGMALIIAVPPFLLWDDGAVRTLLKHIPILNSAAWPMRWIVIYIPVTQLLLAIPMASMLEKTPSRYVTSFMGVMLSLIWAGPLTSPIDYYLNKEIQSYNPLPVIQAFNRLRTDGPIPIDRIATPQNMTAARNDTMLQGASQGFCYNPLYGYRLESFPQINRLREGAALSMDASGQTLLFNPACLVHPEANACRPGDGFHISDADQRVQANRFIQRHPFEWQRPLFGKVLAWLSQLTFWIMSTFILLFAWRAFLRGSRA